MSARPVLDVRALSIQRGDTSILREVSWQVKPGEHWVILGPNGSGKTSLLRALTGYLSPTAGEISVLGRTYGRSDWRVLRKKVGLVSSSIRQMMAEAEPALDSVISGKYAMIDFWGKATPTDRARARRILARIECGHLADRRWEILSQGERQRILIGRALMARPRLLILDEPCAGLDPAAREHFLQFVQRLGRSADSPTLILVTHHIEEIMPVFSHVVVLKEGSVIAAGPRSAVLKNSILTQAFNIKMVLQRSGERLSLRSATRRRLIL